MAYVVLKSNTGVDFAVGDKIIPIHGKGYLNDVSKSDLDELKKNKMFARKVDNGFIVISDKDVSEKVADDTKQDTINKQTLAINSNEKANKVKVIKE